MMIKMGIPREAVLQKMRLKMPPKEFATRFTKYNS